MALKSNFNEARSMRDIEKQAEVIYNKMLNSYIMAGEQFVINARGQLQSHAMGQYHDQTTNLRNSIGYFVFYNGTLVRNDNKIAINRAKIDHLINPRGFQLIGIAGMNYASHVESKGYNVISYQADIAVIDLALSLEKINVVGGGTAAGLEETFIPD